MTPERYRLHIGEALSWLMSLPEGCADALITDPPYCSGGMSTTSRKAKPSSKYQHSDIAYSEFEGENRDQRSWAFWMNLWLTAAYRALRPGAPACVFTDWRQYPSTTDVFQSAGFTWRGVVVVRICEPGGLILDPFAGSGATGVAALDLGYRFWGCELVPEIAEGARTWLEQACEPGFSAT